MSNEQILNVCAFSPSKEVKKQNNIRGHLGTSITDITKCKDKSNVKTETDNFASKLNPPGASPPCDKGEKERTHTDSAHEIACPTNHKFLKLITLKRNRFIYDIHSLLQ